MHTIVLLTALPPTIGHLELIKFAYLLADDGAGGGRTTVLVSTLPDEPLPGWLRVQSLQEAVRRLFPDMTPYISVVELLTPEGTQQSPDPERGDDPDFWRMWAGLMTDAIGHAPERGRDYLVSSEGYGRRLAQELGIDHVPHDPERVMVPSQATHARMHPLLNFHHILPEVRPDLRLNATIFGAESVGKSTTSRKVAEQLRAYHVPEWARTYLEREADPAPTIERMAMIVRGQAASQVVSCDCPSMVVVRDTDLLSTIGYYRLLGLPQPPALDELQALMQADLYVVLTSDIPFEADALRYGGDRRESTDQFWIDLLEEYGCTYVVVSSTGRARVRDATSRIREAALASHSLWSYQRRSR